MSLFGSNAAPQVANGGLAPPPGVVYQGEAASFGGDVFTAVAPVAQQQTQAGSKRQRVLGLVPAVAGSMHPMIVRETRTPVSRNEIAALKATIRKADREKTAAEAAWMTTCTPQNTKGDEGMLLKARDAADVLARHRARLAEIEAHASHRAIKTVIVPTREPSEVPHVLASGETHYVCLHEKCRTKRFAHEGELRTDDEHNLRKMVNAQETHVFALYSEEPFDPLDAEGERCGYIAPVGSDGTKVARADAPDGDDAGADVAELKAENLALTERLAKLEALMANMATPAAAADVKKK
jgi:hypothetical protein